MVAVMVVVISPLASGPGSSFLGVGPGEAEPLEGRDGAMVVSALCEGEV